MGGGQEADMQKTSRQDSQQVVLDRVGENKMRVLCEPEPLRVSKARTLAKQIPARAAIFKTVQTPSQV